MNPETIPGQPVFFVSDTHFKDRPSPKERKRRRCFLTFLARLAAPSTLFLLGDIFDFYFEYPSVVMSGYYDLYQAFGQLRERGVELHFLGGNHDSWTGPFLEKHLGFVVHRDRVILSSQGRRVVCVHGDLILPGDLGYKLFKNLTRNRVAVALGRALHPEILTFLARRVSVGSKIMRKKSHELLAHQLAKTAFTAFFQQGNDAFVMGHVHYPFHRSQDGKDFLILGDWVEHRSYGVLADGKLSLEFFRG